MHEAHKALLKAAGGGKKDEVAYDAVAEHLLKMSGAARSDFDHAPDTAHAPAYFEVVVRRGVTRLSAAEVNDVMSVCDRVLSLRFVPACEDADKRAHNNKVVVCVRFAHTDPKDPALPVVATFGKLSRKRSATQPIDWAASGVTDDEDVRKLSDVVEHVFHMQTRMPAAARVWLEHIGGNGCATIRGAPAPLVDDAMSSLASETSEDQDAEGVFGFALCFAGMPEIDGRFLGALRTHHGTRLTCVYVWTGVGVPRDASPDGAHLLVVNVHCAALAPSEPLLRACRAHRVLGLSTVRQ